MYSASDLRKGLKVEIDGKPYVITDFSFTKPGKGQALYSCRLKNMIDGGTLSKTFRANDKIDTPHLEQHTVTYSYEEGGHYVFINEDYEQLHVGADVLGDSALLLTPDIEADILFYNNQPVEVTLPFFVEKKIIETEPGARGNTATDVRKPATVEGGYKITVPIFVEQGDIVRIDTRTGQYSDRVRKFG